MHVSMTEGTRTKRGKKYQWMSRISTEYRTQRFYYLTIHREIKRTLVDIRKQVLG